jgi:acyl carrier protein
VEQIIKQYIVNEFVPDITVDELATDYDLLAGGMIDSLSLLKVIAWLQERFGLDIDQIELAPEYFRTVAEISAFVQCNSTPERR